MREEGEATVKKKYLKNSAFPARSTSKRGCFYTPLNMVGIPTEYNLQIKCINNNNKYLLFKFFFEFPV